MGDHTRTDVFRVARKPHRCTYCGERIEPGERYRYVTGTFEGRWYASKLHIECNNELNESGEDEFTPYSNERPQRGKK